MPGFTAYYGLFEIGRPQEGEVVFVSGAAGAVGSAVGQMAKIAGCRVLGSAGTAEKLAWLRELGFRATSARDLRGELLAARAGLGRLDADGRLVTREFGTRAHVADVILTDLPLAPDG